MHWIWILNDLRYRGWAPWCVRRSELQFGEEIWNPTSVLLKSLDTQSDLNFSTVNWKKASLQTVGSSNKNMRIIRIPDGRKKNAEKLPVGLGIMHMVYNQATGLIISVQYGNDRSGRWLASLLGWFPSRPSPSAHLLTRAVHLAFHLEFWTRSSKNLWQAEKGRDLAPEWKNHWK